MSKSHESKPAAKPASSSTDTKAPADTQTEVEGSRLPTSIGTGAPNLTGTPSPDPDPNIDMSRAVARDTREAKLAAGEKPGAEAEAPVALANQPRGPQGPVPPGMRRVKVKTPIQVGGRHYGPGEIVDIPEDDASSLSAAIDEG